MKVFAPDYYKDFKCTAELCKHSCCIGWEIDIDDETFEYYKNINSDFGKRIRENIVENDGCNCFKLNKNERCPFLNENNLCNIILELGEDSLCQICTDHPRFRNFYSDRVEIGLGLCCEEAARIILTNNKNVNLIEIDNDNDDIICDETDFFNLRNKIFNYFSDENVSLLEKMAIKKETILSKSILKNYLTLEILDKSWNTLLQELIDNYDDIQDIVIPQQFENSFEQLLLYFTYRHFTLLLDGTTEESVLNFIRTSVSIIYSLCQLHISKYNDLNIEHIIEYSRMYSSEIEYSEENLNTLIV